MKQFFGIAPRFDTFLQEGYAVIAENCDLSSGKLKPIKQDLHVDNSRVENDFAKFNNQWQTKYKYYTIWDIGDHSGLYYLDGTRLVKKIGSTIASVGQQIPELPDVTVLSEPGNLLGSFQYIITWIRSVGGFVDESGPSAPSPAVTIENTKGYIQRPDKYDSNVTHWNLYRISSNTGEFQFVAKVPISNNGYIDNIKDEDLSASPTTWYTSKQGNEIIFAPPPPLDGFAGLHGGMLFGWKGAVLYWCEPGVPDAWPSYYSVNFPSDIKACAPFAGSLAVLTQQGAFRIDGNNPELLQQIETLGTEPCINTSICRSSKGVFYISDSGLCLFDNFNSVVVSDQAFTERWFKENINMSSIALAENDNVIYLFHNTGTLYYDLKTGQWATTPGRYSTAWKNVLTGELYAANLTGIYKINADHAETLNWKSGDITAAIKDIPWKEIEVLGSGDITLTCWVDSIKVAEKTLEFGGLYRNRALMLPQEYQGRRLQLQFQGTGKVEEAIPKI